MNILFIVVGDFSPVSGVGKTAFSLAHHLSQNHRVTVTASGRDRRTQPGIAFYKAPFWHPGKRWEFFFPLPLLWNFILGSCLCFASRKRYDVVHVFNGLVWSKSSLITLQMCQKGAFNFLSRNSPWQKLRRKTPKHLTILFLEWLVYRWSLFKKLVVSSESEKKEIIGYYRVNPGDMMVLYNGIEPVRLSPSEEGRIRAEKRREWGYSENDTVCLFVGYDLKRKGLEYVLKALPNLSSKHKLLVVGGRDTSGTYRRLATALSVSDRVQFAGQSADISGFYASADIFVLPTLFEPFGTAILEAMSWSLPVVTSRAAGAAELITDGKEGFLLPHPRDSRKIAACLEQLSQKERRLALGKRARETAAHCTWELRARELTGFYRSIS